VVDALTAALKTRGAAREGQFSKQWFFASLNVANRMLKAYSTDELRSAINWLLDEPYVGKGIGRMTDIEKHMTRWLRRNEAHKGQPQPKNNAPYLQPFKPGAPNA
jgi:hypothetical protein